MSWVLMAFVAAAAAAVGYRLGRRPPPAGSGGVPPSADAEHTLDLLRRAHGATVAVVIGERSDAVAAADPQRATAEQIERGRALARVALADDRRHRLDEPAVAVAAASGGIAVAVVFPGHVADAEAERAQADAWRLAAGIAERRSLEDGRRRLTETPDGLEALGLCETVDSAALALCQSVGRTVDRTTALVLRDEFSGILSVVRVSLGGDRRLEGSSALPGSAVARAVETDTPVAGLSLPDLLGHPRTDRRRGIEAGLAFPLRDGRRPVGALVVFGAPDRLDSEEREVVERLLFAAAPRVSHLLAVEAREVRARTDELTGLPNRRGLERAMAMLESGRAAMLIADLDHFKRVNDRYGHVAGDAALRHLAGLLRRALRTQDMAVRIGGEEFALWLPDADLAVATDVAERVRAMIESTPLQWSGQEITLTCSLGVASAPGSTTVIENLYSMADAALYRAKERGRNRVEVAPGG